MNDSDILKMLPGAFREAGSLRGWAKQHGMTASYVSSVMHKRSRPGPRILAALGLERRETISPLRKGRHDE
jgi:hypothetical protein